MQALLGRAPPDVRSTYTAYGRLVWHFVCVTREIRLGLHHLPRVLVLSCSISPSRRCRYSFNLTADFNSTLQQLGPAPNAHEADTWAQYDWCHREKQSLACCRSRCHSVTNLQVQPQRSRSHHIISFCYFRRTSRCVAAASRRTPHASCSFRSGSALCTHGRITSPILRYGSTVVRQVCNSLPPCISCALRYSACSLPPVLDTLSQVAALR
jgi:hypothetical protein